MTGEYETKTYYRKGQLQLAKRVTAFVFKRTAKRERVRFGHIAYEVGKDSRGAFVIGRAVTQ